MYGDCVYIMFIVSAIMFIHLPRCGGLVQSETDPGFLQLLLWDLLVHGQRFCHCLRTCEIIRRSFNQLVVSALNWFILSTFMLTWLNVTWFSCNDRHQSVLSVCYCRPTITTVCCCQLTTNEVKKVVWILSWFYCRRKFILRYDWCVHPCVCLCLSV